MQKCCLTDFCQLKLSMMMKLPIGAFCLRLISFIHKSHFRVTQDPADAVIWNANAFHPVPPRQQFVGEQPMQNQHQPISDRQPNQQQFHLDSFFSVYICESNACHWFALLRTCFNVVINLKLPLPVKSADRLLPPLCTDRQLSSTVYRPSAFLHCVQTVGTRRKPWIF